MNQAVADISDYSLNARMLAELRELPAPWLDPELLFAASELGFALLRSGVHEAAQLQLPFVRQALNHTDSIDILRRLPYWLNDFQALAPHQKSVYRQCRALLNDSANLPTLSLCAAVQANLPLYLQNPANRAVIPLRDNLVRRLETNRVDTFEEVVAIIQACLIQDRRLRRQALAPFFRRQSPTRWQHYLWLRPRFAAPALLSADALRQEAFPLPADRRLRLQVLTSLTGAFSINC